jgi:hypothetical protein
LPFDRLNTCSMLTLTMIIRPSPTKRRARYEEVEFDVPGVVRTKRYCVDIALGKKVRISMTQT